MNTATIAFLIEQGFTVDDIEAMKNSIGTHSTNDDAGSNDFTNDDADSDHSTNDGAGSDGSTNDDAGSNESEAISELTKTVKELSDTVKAMQEQNAKTAKGGKATKKNSESVIKDFFGQS